MLFVFHVDTGKMMTFDMSLTLESVENLKLAVEKECKIPADKQILLISGGEWLNSSRSVCSYSAGTDTNPIFLFSRFDIDDSQPQSPSIDLGAEYAYRTLLSDLNEKLKECCDLPATLNTVSRRTQLAQEFYELAKDQTITCENLVHDQHLQQQGWCAVVANLEDTTTAFKKRVELLERDFNEYMAERDSYFESLTHFEKDVQLLRKIPVLRTLLELFKANLDKQRLLDALTTSEASGTSETSETNINTLHDIDVTKEWTLLDWLSSIDEESTVEDLYANCSFGLEQFDAQVFADLKKEIDEILADSENVGMREVRGLGERLFGLENLMREAKVFVQQQADLAQSFLKNQNRASNMKDQSILPDLCASHKKQLQLIFANHQQLCDIRRRCTKAKQELGTNLHARLKWVMYIEGEMAAIHKKMTIFFQNMRRLRENVQVLQQVHMAPATYLCAVAEVVRRRSFSQSFMVWASELACHFLVIHNEEMARRKEFHAQFHGHFLNTLFPGMTDLPPPFATQAPSPFDCSLPQITMEDVDMLKRKLPDLADSLSVPDTSAISQVLSKWFEKKGEEKIDETKAVEEKLVEAVSEVGLGSKLDGNLIKGTGSEPCLATTHGLPHLKDLDRGCESETDTEEFEKVGQSPLELNFDKQIPSPRPGSQDASTSTEDNLQISKSEHDRLKAALMKMHFLAKEAAAQVRSELYEIKTLVLTDQKVVSQHYESLSGSWENLISEKDIKEKELVMSIKKDYEMTLNDLKKVEQEKDKQIETLSTRKDALEMLILKSDEQYNELQDSVAKITEENNKKIDELQKQLHEKELEKEKSIKEVTDRLNREHKAEMENIRSRFKLMTMERSPSETNLEKSNEFSSLPGHSTLLMQMTENFELDKEKAVAEALKMSDEKWETLLADKVKEMEETFKVEKDILIQEVSQKITEEKEMQIDMLRERETNLKLECSKYKTTIQQLAEYGTESNESELVERIKTLQSEKESLEAELARIKSEKATDLAASMTVYVAKSDAATSPVKQKETSKSERQGKAHFDHCKVGDPVLILWDGFHSNFRVVQEKYYIYFLHSDSFGDLGLDITNGKPNKDYSSGEVVAKEYCHARKSENRYRVPKGTKFFRMKVKPLPPLPPPAKDVTQSLYHPKSSISESPNMFLSHSTISTITEVIPEDKSTSQSPSSSPARETTLVLEICEEKEEDPMPSRPCSIEQSIYEDSGIVDNVAQASGVQHETTYSESIDDSESDRFQFFSFSSIFRS